jgi:hypothetical protein
MKSVVGFLTVLMLAAHTQAGRDVAAARDSGVIACEGADRMVVRAAPVAADSGLEQRNSVTFTGKDIKAAAGAAGDVSRYLSTMPSIVSALGAKFDNTLFVRGGRPNEIVFFVDGIEMENINHFSQANGSGGPIGFINSDYIRSVRFFAGDIPVSYPPKMSSVADIDMKAGSFSSVNGDVGVKLTGGMGSVEGPVFGGAGSFALAGRYVDFSALKSIIGDEGIPKLGDLYGKLLFLPSANLVISATGLFSYNTYRYGFPVIEQGDDGASHANGVDEIERIVQGGAGVRFHFKDSVQEHRFSASYSRRSGQSYDSLESFSDTFFTGRYAKNPVRGYADDRAHFSLNTTSAFAIGSRQSVSAGVRVYDTKYSFSVEEESMNHGTCVVCENDSPVTVAWTLKPREKAISIEGPELGAFASYELRLGRFSASAGIRADYFRLIDDAALSPRAAAMFSLGGAGNVAVGAGLYHQFSTDLPTTLFDAISANAGMPDDSIRGIELSLLSQAVPLRCRQGSLGYRVSPWNLFTSSVEVYGKWYDREFRYLSPDVQDVLYTTTRGGLALRPQDGRRRVYGAEVSLVNTGRGWFSYSIGASIFDVKNQFDDSGWYDDWTNVGYTFSCAATAVVLRAHTVSLSVAGSGGRPYCPAMVNVDCVGRRSASLDTLAGYYSRRLDRLFTTNFRYGYATKIFKAQTELFLEIINLLNYKPVLEYKFNGTGFQPVTPFGITPIFGISVKF